MHPPEIHAEVQRLVAAGVKDGAIARELGLARTTVRDMRNPRYVPQEARGRCWRCWEPTRPVRFAVGEYAELLGLYLGDGYICRSGRTQRLRISFDARHPQLVADAQDLLERCFPENRVGVVCADEGATRVVSLYSSHLGCLFPQHGAGPKHHRSLALEAWQQEIVDAAPWAFLRGLVHSDGCFFINRTGRYSYLSIDFCSASPDIRRMFVETCARVGIACKANGRRVRLYRRADVALFAALVGAKW